jgi:Fis family transcriptional regulator
MTERCMSKNSLRNACVAAWKAISATCAAPSLAECTTCWCARSKNPLLEVVMAQADHNQSKAAQWLGLNRNTLRKKLLEHKLID